jgi:uncharacterized membrane protein
MKKQRFWEIDAVRGIALIRIVIFNWSFALAYLGIYTFSLGMALPGLGASIFIFLVGLSLTLSYNRVKKRKPKEIYKKYFFRGLKIFGYGVLITVITFLTFPNDFVIFGILHLIGVSIILGQFFLKSKSLNLILGILIIILGFYLNNFSFDFPWLLWLGFAPHQFTTFDYFPILPWFGLTLLGIYFGNILYKNGKRSFKIKDLSNNIVVRFLALLGRKSLFIYLVHQPILIIILLLLGFKVF